jgi:cyclopropane-fatty-acyl-phospholipid synthase
MSPIVRTSAEGIPMSESLVEPVVGDARRDAETTRKARLPWARDAVGTSGPVDTRRPGRSPAAGVGSPTDVPGDRRLVLARAIVRLVGLAVVDPHALEIVLDDGSSGVRGVPVMGGVAPRARVVVRGPDAVARLLLPPSPNGFAEGYLRGDLDIEGDVTAAIAAGRALDLRRLGPEGIRRLARWAMELRRGPTTAARLGRIARLTGERHSRARDMAAVRFHYDVGNDFFGLWLDRRLTYSCAWFPDGTTPADAPDLLDEAQEAKLDLVARKLRLGPGMRLLDIGSGWGSLIIRVAEHHGADAVGVTLSARQADESNVRARAAALDDRAVGRVLDYRDLGGLGTFDAVASIGMFEHVGRANLEAYFRAAFDALRPGGLFLNHGIAGAGRPSRRRGPTPRPRENSFVERYVFPDGELVPAAEALAIARSVGFELIDLQSLRPHYALTLAAWVNRLEGRWDEAVAAGGEEVARTWRLYMSAARLGFERGDLDVCQLLLARPGSNGSAGRPLRPWW